VKQSIEFLHDRQVAMAKKKRQEQEKTGEKDAKEIANFKGHCRRKPELKRKRRSQSAASSLPMERVYF